MLTSSNPPELTKPRQSSGDFWREQWANGLTQSQLKAVMNSLPRIEPINSPTKPQSPLPTQPQATPDSKP